MGLFAIFAIVAIALIASSKKSSTTKAVTVQARDNKKKSKPADEAKTPTPVSVPQPSVELLQASVAKVQSSEEKIKSTLGIDAINGADLNVVIALPTIPAIGSALKTALKLDPRNHTTLIQDLTAASTARDILKVIEDGDKTLNQLFSQIGIDINKNLKAIDNGYPDILKNIIESTTLDATNIITSIIRPDVELDDKVFKEVINLVSRGRLDLATEILKNFSNLSEAEISTKLNDIRRNVSQILYDRSGPTSTAKQIGTDISKWKEADTKEEYQYGYIESEEELELELKSIQREITEVVIHWTTTPNDLNIGAEELQDMWKEQKSIGIPYHYIIRRDGRLQRGRPIEVLCPNIPDLVRLSHHLYSIHIAFVGGYNAPQGTPNIENTLSSDSLTTIQYQTLDHFLHMFFTAFPGGQVLGHNDIDRDASDPGYDVKEYVKTHFGRTNEFENSFVESSFTVKELLTKEYFIKESQDGD